MKIDFSMMSTTRRASKPASTSGGRECLQGPKINSGRRSDKAYGQCQGKGQKAGLPQTAV